MSEGLIRITRDSIKVPRVVLGTNSENQEVFLYFDEELQRVVISGCTGLAYEQVAASGSSKVYLLDMVSPSLNN